MCSSDLPRLQGQPPVAAELRAARDPTGRQTEGPGVLLQGAAEGTGPRREGDHRAGACAAIGHHGGGQDAPPAERSVAGVLRVRNCIQ